MYHSDKALKFDIPQIFILFLLVFCLPLFSQPANDECSTATVISSIPFTDTVNTTLATNNPADPMLSCNFDGNQTDGNTVWYTWTPQNDVTVQINSFGSNYDVALGVFIGDCNNLVEVACVDVGIADAFMFDAEANVTYFIKVGEFMGGDGGGTLIFRVGELEPIVLESVRSGLSAPISSLVSALPKRSTENPTTEEVPMYMQEEDGKDESSGSVPGNGTEIERLNENQNFLKGTGPNEIQTPNAPSQIELLQSFAGAENDDNAFELGILLAPPDTDGDVGINHYVQMTNLVTTIYDKSGNVVLGPFGNNVFWSGLSGLCENTNRGDPIVLYDEETDTWFVSQFAFDATFTEFSLCVACSETGDPTGSYFQHEFDFTDIGFPDYPKYGYATDAIAVMANLFVPFQGTGIGAIDKGEAYSAGPATMVFFKLGTNEFGFVAGDNDGPVFSNIPPTFATNNAGSFGNTTIDFWEINPDFAVPSNSTAGEVAAIPVTPFDHDLCNAPRERCIHQPGSGTGTFPNNITFLEAISDRLMHRLQLRNFGNDKRAVVTHTVDTDGNGTAGLRWYEFRNHKDKGWKLFKENTFSPDGDHRWMGSIAMNTKGETCIGYSISSSSTYPSIAVAGRRGESSHLNLGELLVFDGNVAQNVQRQTARWGDYSAMAVDPVDGSFWYTQEYAKPNSFIGERFGWATQIFQVHFKGGPKQLAADEKDSETLVTDFALFQNHPNPFNPETEIRFQIPETHHVSLKIFNALGQEIRKLVDSEFEKGHHSIRWDGRDNQGQTVSSGIYFYKLQAGEFEKVHRMNLVR